MATLAFWGLILSFLHISWHYFHTSKNHPQTGFISYFHSLKSITIYNYVLFNTLACIFVAFNETVTKDTAPN